MAAPHTAFDNDGNPAVRKTAEVNVSIELVHDTDQYDLRPGYKTGHFRPQTLSLRYYCTPNSQWRVAEATVKGPMVKKNGQLSDSLRGERRFALYSAGLDVKTPQWVHDLIAEHTPFPFSWAD